MVDPRVDKQPSHTLSKSSAVTTKDCAWEQKIHLWLHKINKNIGLNT